MPEFLADAPPWIAGVFWAAAAVFAALFGVAVPKLRSILTTVVPPAQLDTTMRLIGAALGPGLDTTKIANDVERIADALEEIGDAVKSIAKSEESGQMRMLEGIAERLNRVYQRNPRLKGIDNPAESGRRFDCL